MSGNKMLETISNQAHAKYGHKGKVGIQYFAEVSKQLAAFPSSDIIAYHIANFDLRYVLDFLLSSPMVWNEMNKSDWIQTFQLSLPRPSFEKLPEVTGAYGDLIFLYKFVKVDGIQLLLNEPSIPDDDKAHTIKYSIAHAPYFFSDDLDEEDLDGEYFVEMEELDRYRKKLLSENLECTSLNTLNFKRELKGFFKYLNI